MGTLSEHFSISEFACRDGCGTHKVDADLIEALEEFRAILELPIVVLSGCRCSRHNAKENGARHSYHLTIRNRCRCQAADVAVAGLTSYELAEKASHVKRFRDGGIGTYPDRRFIHVDVRISGAARWQE